MSGAPAHQLLTTTLPPTFRIARFHDQRPAPRSLFPDAPDGMYRAMPNSAAIAIELLRRELMQLTAVVAEQNRLIQNMHDQLFTNSFGNSFGNSGDGDLIFEGSSAPLSEPILPYTIGVGREAENLPADARRRGLGRGLEALFQQQPNHPSGYERNPEAN